MGNPVHASSDLSCSNTLPTHRSKCIQSSFKVTGSCSKQLPIRMTENIAVGIISSNTPWQIYNGHNAFLGPFTFAHKALSCCSSIMLQSRSVLQWNTLPGTYK